MLHWSMHFVYVDDSKDEKSVCFSALLVPAKQWMLAYDHLIGTRRTMRLTDGVLQSVELHATDWLAGRGNVAVTTLPKGARARLFDYVLSAIVLMPGIRIINAHAAKSDEMMLFERLMNRIDTFANKASSHALIISDEGKSYDALLRRMRRYNPIPSQFGAWSTGTGSMNLPVQRILEDIVYRDSAKNYFIQAADFCAFSLLRMENPTANARKYGFDQSFHILKPVLVTNAYGRDPRRLGIIRV